MMKCPAWVEVAARCDQLAVATAWRVTDPKLELSMTKRPFAVAICLCIFALTLSLQTRTQIQASGTALVEAYVSAWNRRDFAALDRLLAPDALHEDMARPSRD